VVSTALKSVAIAVTGKPDAAKVIVVISFDKNSCILKAYLGTKAPEMYKDIQVGTA
jgi:hypothetical protein